eukprot:940523-Alexandrium_andersonii.AAC.1
MKFKRGKTGRGYQVSRNLPSLGLLAHDCLVPQDGLRDVGSFAYCPVPCDLVFWRAANQGFVTRRNPIFDPALG